MPMRIANPRKARMSVSVTSVQLIMLSSPNTCRAYKFVCSIMVDINVAVKKRRKVSRIEGVMETAGPTDSVNG